MPRAVSPFPYCPCPHSTRQGYHSLGFRPGLAHRGPCGLLFLWCLRIIQMWELKDLPPNTQMTDTGPVSGVTVFLVSSISSLGFTSAHCMSPAGRLLMDRRGDLSTSGGPPAFSGSFASRASIWKFERKVFMFSLPAAFCREKQDQRVTLPLQRRLWLRLRVLESSYFLALFFPSIIVPPSWRSPLVRLPWRASVRLHTGKSLNTFRPPIDGMHDDDDNGDGHKDDVDDEHLSVREYKLCGSKDFWLLALVVNPKCLERGPVHRTESANIFDWMKGRLPHTGTRLDVLQTSLFLHEVAFVSSFRR